MVPGMRNLLCTALIAEDAKHWFALVSLKHHKSYREFISKTIELSAEKLQHSANPRHWMFSVLLNADKLQLLFSTLEVRDLRRGRGKKAGSKARRAAAAGRRRPGVPVYIQGHRTAPGHPTLPAPQQHQRGERVAPGGAAGRGGAPCRDSGTLRLSVALSRFRFYTYTHS